MFQKQTKISDFPDVIHITSKNELKITLSEKLKYWILFPLKNNKLRSVLCDQVNQSSSSLTFSLVSAASMNDFLITQGKRIIDHK